jgi:hypothetical protein
LGDNVKLKEFKNLLENNRDKPFQLQLPNQQPVPVSFHITEVAQVNKTFIDCGGKVHSVQTCQLQAWVGEDEDHRLNAGKIADILKLAQNIVPDDDVDLEIEYEDAVISQYPVARYLVTPDAVTLVLTTKHTDCLAKEICIVPSACGTAGCC